LDAGRDPPELAFISIGSNIQPERHLPQALARLKDLGDLLRISNVYQNPARGPVEQDDFLNAAALLAVDVGAGQLRASLRAIEQDLGRRRGETLPGLTPREAKYAPRTIDLDLSLLGQQVIHSGPVQLPDPDILTMAHVAVPLAELAPDFRHPETDETLQAIARRLSDQAQMTPRPDIWRAEELPTAGSSRHSRLKEERNRGRR
jgi:2-amino-4-hydroxy-6-hydroxymethyldihydropteridine diphosphokinase